MTSTSIISLSGSHCVGKTIFANLVQSLYPDKFYIIEEEVQYAVNKLGHTQVSEVHSSELQTFQLYMVQEHFKNIMFTSCYCNNQFALSDRSYLDILAYSLLYKDFIDVRFLDKVQELCAGAVRNNTYSKYIYFPLYNIKAKTNNFRKLDYRVEVDTIIQELLSDFNISYYTAPEFMDEWPLFIKDMFKL